MLNVKSVISKFFNWVKDV